MDYSELIIFIMEIVGTIAFASSGAMLAVRKNMDLFGVCVLGVVTSVGVNTARSLGYSQDFLLIFVGVITGVGGGLLRDMMAQEKPYILTKHIYACASIAGAFVCVYSGSRMGNLTSMMVGAAVVIVVRLLAMHYRWNLPRI